MSSITPIPYSPNAAFEAAFHHPARNLTKSREKNIIRFCSQPIGLPYYLDGKYHMYD